MNGAAWIGLIQQIPESQQDNLVAVTSTGAEIMVQKILVLKEEFMIFRGRPAGSTDVPRILLMPFDQLNHLAFSKPLKEAEIQALFGSGTAAAVETPTQTTTVPPVATVEPVNENTVAEEPPPPSAPVAAEPVAAEPAPAKPAPPSKSILLARLRARLSKG